MILELKISERGKVKRNKKGQAFWVVTQLANLRGCCKVLYKLNNLMDGEIANYGTFSFRDTEFLIVLRELKEELKAHENNTYKPYRFTSQPDETYEEEKAKYNKEQAQEIKFNIHKLEKFLKEENITSKTAGTRTFEVYVRWYLFN